MSDEHNGFKLGEISAKIDSIGSDVKSVKDSLDDIRKDYRNIDKRVTEIESAREIQVPQHNKLRHDFANHVTADTKWKSDQSGFLRGVSRTLKLMWIVGGAIIGLSVAVTTYYATQARMDARHIEQMQLRR